MTRNLLVVVLVAILVSTLANGRYIADTKLRSKRQTGDLKAAAYQAWLALGRTLPPDCPEVACGVVDVEASGKKKRTDRSSVDFRRSLLVERLLRLAAEGLVNSV